MSEGTRARSNRCVRPLAKSGLDLAIEGLDLGLGAGGANPVCGRLYPDGPWSSAFRAAFAVRRPSILARVSVNAAGRSLRRSGAWALPRRPFGSEDRARKPGQRAGPVRFEPQVTLVFRAAVSLGPLTFRRNPL